MKQYILLALFISCFTGFKANAGTNETTRTHCYDISNLTDTLPADSLELLVRYINLAGYSGRAVDSFLTIIPNTPTSMFISSCVMGKKSMYNACYLQVAYYPDITIRIYVKEFTHMPRYSATLNWDMNLFRQEKIYRISVYKDSKCINGFCRY